jgi:hypothetical protein
VSRIPAKEIERNRDEPCGRDHEYVVPANHTCDGRTVCFASGAGTPRDLSGHYDLKAVLRLCAKCDGEQAASTNHYPRKTDRRQECATVFNIDATAQLSVARSVRDDLGSSDTTAGEPPSAPGSAPTDSRLVERTTADFYLVFRPPNNAGGYPAAISRSSPFRNKEIAQ